MSEPSHALPPDPLIAAATEAGSSPQGTGATTRSDQGSPSRDGEADVGAYAFLRRPRGRASSAGSVPTAS